MKISKNEEDFYLFTIFIHWIPFAAKTCLSIRQPSFPVENTVKTRRVLSHGVEEHATSITSSRRSLKVLQRVGNVDGSRRRSSSRSSFFGGVSALCRAFFYLGNGCIQRVSDGRLKIMMPRVGRGLGRSLSLSLVDVVMEELEMWSYTIK